LTGFVVKSVENESGDASTKLAIFDIDGVLADVHHRLHFIAKPPKDWKAFFAAADEDPLLTQGYELAHEFAETHEVLYLTGRPESSRKITGAWLVDQRLPPGRLLMRPSRDFRPARAYKIETLHRLPDSHDIGVVIDDDPAVVKALRDDGFPAHLATWHPYTSALSVAQEREGRT
jgi:FMN phosphatase YigB (HAD superfamily)